MIPYDGPLMKLFFFETDGQWAALARRRFSGDISVVEIRNLDELWSQLSQSAESVVAIQWTTANDETLLAALARIACEFPRVTTIVLAARDLAAWANLCREMGATHFIISTRQIVEIVEIAKRKMQSGAASAAGQDETIPLEERILNGLPWPKAAQLSSE
jgi:hypothetical protein